MRSAAASILVIVALTGCNAGSGGDPVGPPSGVRAALRSNPLTSASAPSEAEESFAGRVAERLDAGGYSYLAVDRGAGEWTWVATMGRGAEVGAQVHVEGFAAQDEFHSRRLDRRFDRIVFGVVEDVAG